MQKQKKKAGSKIFHLEYKHKTGAEKHRYYTSLTQLARFNPNINAKISTLQHYNFKAGIPYENETVFIYLGALIDKTVQPPKDKAGSKTINL